MSDLAGTSVTVSTKDEVSVIGEYCSAIVYRGRECTLRSGVCYAQCKWSITYIVGGRAYSMVQGTGCRDSPYSSDKITLLNHQWMTKMECQLQYVSAIGKMVCALELISSGTHQRIMHAAMSSPE